MAKKVTKQVQRIHNMFEIANGENRAQWEYINQKGVDFANDNQLTDEERVLLEEQGMPTFTINRILPVVEMLNFYATANKPRWQAIGTDGSDTDIAAVFSDMADYIWDLSDGSSLYANCVNDSVTKGIGYLHVTVNQDSDNGMGDVVIKNPEPFDVFVDPKSRDILFRDASFIMIRKVLPKSHLMKLYPDMVSKIKTKTPGFGLKFTRGLGAFSIFSTITGVLRAKKEAKQTLKKFGIKREPSVMETLQHTMPKWARPKYYKSLATDV